MKMTMTPKEQKRLFVSLASLTIVAVLLCLVYVIGTKSLDSYDPIVSSDSSVADAADTSIAKADKQEMPEAPVSANNVSENTAQVTDTLSSNTVSDTATDITEEPAPSAMPDRVTYADGFYYESLSETVKERINGKSYKADCIIPYEDLRYLSVLYCDFEGNTQTGEIICNKAIAQDLIEIFCELYQNEYQIDKIRLIDEYDADDDLSCADNNTSCFNYRTVAGSNNLSNHAKGRAIDINPFQNPYVTYPNGTVRISPPGSEPYADRSSGLKHMITEDDLCYKLFREHGFTWGGHWKSLKDYQHFEKKE